MLLLTSWAIVGAAAGAADFFDNRAATRAGSALLTEDFEVVSVVTILATSIDKMLEGCTADRDGVLHDVS